MNSIADRDVCFVLDTRRKEMKKDLLCGQSSVNPIDCTTAITYVLWSNLDEQKKRIFHYNEDSSLIDIEFKVGGTYGVLLERLRDVSFSLFFFLTYILSGISQSFYHRHSGEFYIIGQNEVGNKLISISISIF